MSAKLVEEFMWLWHNWAGTVKGVDIFILRGESSAPLLPQFFPHRKLLYSPRRFLVINLLSTVQIMSLASRVFRPQSLLPYYDRNRDVNPNDVACYDRHLKHYTMLTKLGSDYVQPQSIMVFIDGACLDNGGPNARAGYGVYFGDDSPHSLSRAVRAHERQTSQRAELRSALAALYQIRRLIDFRNGNIKKIVLVTDSAYVARSMSEYVVKWRDNNYMSARGFEVVNRDLIELLDNEIVDLEEDDDCVVQFWKVPRAWNTDADSLAKDAAE